MKTALVALAAVAILVATPLARAQTWTGLDAPDNNWTEILNWDTAVPVSGNTALFNGAGNANTSISLGGASQPINTIQFDTASAAAYTLGVLASGDTFNFDAGGQITSAAAVANPEIINAALNTNGNLTVTNASTNTTGLTLGGNVSIASNSTLNVTNTGRMLTLSGNISGGTINTTSLSLTGRGSTFTAAITGTNTYTGNTTIDVNVLQIGSNSPFGTGKVTWFSPPTAVSQNVQAIGGNWTIANAIDMNAGPVFNSATNSLTFTGPITVINAAAGSTVGRTINMSVAGTVTYGSSPGSSTITLGNPVSNGGDGVGKTLILNAVTGGTITVNDVMQDPAAGGAPPASGNVQIQGGGGIIQVNAQNTYTGTTVVTGASSTVAVGSSSMVGSGPLGTGVVTFTSSTGTAPRIQASGAQTVANNITLAGTGNSGMRVQGADNLTLTGVISGGTTTAITKADGGMLTLSGSNTHSGITQILAGTIAIGHNNAFGTGVLNLGGTSANTPTILASGSARTIANNVALVAVTTGNATIGGTNDLTINGTLTNSASNRTLAVNNSGSTTFGVVNLSNDATGRTLTLTGTGNMTLGGVIQNGGAGNGNLTFNSSYAGTATINGTNTYSGATTLSAGTFVLGNKAAFGTSSVAANGVSMSASTNLSGANAIVNTAITLGGDNTFTGSNSIEFTGTVTETSSRIVTNNMSGVDLTFSGPVNLSSNAVDNVLTIAGSGNTSITNTIANGGTSTVSSLTKMGAGTLVLAGQNTYAGGTTVSGGTLLVNNSLGSGTGSGAVLVGASGTLGGTGTIVGSVTSDGKIEPGGSIGTLSVNGALDLNPASTLAYELTLSGSGQQTIGSGVNDLIEDVTALTLGDATNGTILDVINSSGIAAAQAGDRWTLITYTPGNLTVAGPGLVLGSLPALNDNSLFYGIDLSVAGQVALLVSAVPEAGSFAAVGLVGLLSLGGVWIRRQIGRGTADI